MLSGRRPIPQSARRFRGRPGLLAAAATLLAPAPAAAQAPALPAGPYVEAEIQAAVGESGFAAGYVPSFLDPTTGRTAELDDGTGWGGALAIGYGWGNGWRGALRYRRLDAEDSGGPIDPLVFAFAAGDSSLPGGTPVPIFAARTEVESKAWRIDLEAGKDIALPGGHVQLFGGISYLAIDRDAALIDTCSCDLLALFLSSTFHGGGPKVGFRGNLPIGADVRLVGGASVAALIGTSAFRSVYVDPLFPTAPFTDKSRRAAAALDAEAGFAFAVGAGTLTLGYRVDAILGALDTDQRVSSLMRDFGFPKIGDRRDDFIQHGPFARFALPLAAAGD